MIVSKTFLLQQHVTERVAKCNIKNVNMIVYMLCERSNQLIGWCEMFTMGTDLKWPWDNG